MFKKKKKLSGRLIHFQDQLVTDFSSFPLEMQNATQILTGLWDKYVFVTLHFICLNPTTVHASCLRVSVC